MKLAFSTLGCPNWPWKEIFAAAKDLGIDGIEIRGIENEMYAPRVRIFDSQNREATLRQLSGAGIALTQLTSGATLGMPDSPAAGRQEITDYVDMAQKLGVPYIRVMISPSPARSRWTWNRGKSFTGSFANTPRPGGSACWQRPTGSWQIPR